MPAPLPFEQVYELYASRVLAFCFFLLRNYAAAEDVASDVFISAFSAYDRVQPDPDGVYTWLIRIARNACIDHQRRNQRWVKVMDVLKADHRTAKNDVESVVTANEQLRELFDGMKKLKKRDMQLITLRYVADLSFEEIGVMVGMSAHTASSATHRAMQKLYADQQETTRQAKARFGAGTG